MQLSATRGQHRGQRVRECLYCKKVKKIEGRGLCVSCYVRESKYGDPASRRIKNTCTIEGCERFVHGNGLCKKHYYANARAIKKPSLKQNHPLFQTWCGMMRRCNDPGLRCYERYGAKGITVCERWYDFYAFVHDMGEKPTPEHTVDRIDGKKGYAPENCRWATATEQRRNAKSIVLDEDSVFKIRGLIKEGCSIPALAKVYGCTIQGIRAAATGRTWKDVPGALDKNLKQYQPIT